MEYSRHFVEMPVVVFDLQLQVHLATCTQHGELHRHAQLVDVVAGQAVGAAPVGRLVVQHPKHGAVGVLGHGLEARELQVVEREPRGRILQAVGAEQRYLALQFFAPELMRHAGHQPRTVAVKHDHLERLVGHVAEPEGHRKQVGRQLRVDGALRQLRKPLVLVAAPAQVAGVPEVVGGPVRVEPANTDLAVPVDADQDAASLGGQHLHQG
mmetsp:Transcript_58481/g.162941  ORF Transcript_58481/g.162941 Transcript_58481/m.162941 type:complete len:211 (+) Transcript_58481:2159-2791(+)